MTTWSVTSSHPGGVEICTGTTTTTAQARADALAAARARHTHRNIAGACRYTLHINGQCTAIIATAQQPGDDVDHGQLDELLDRLDATPVPAELDTAGYR
ncbi:hypothetical protein [Mycobacterium simiae]|uniref:hypothetical protein n=1 Tax=Mycobacterium simiae TaxID=1784 RepID=UPI002623F95D|nr:hypothetical protein [Mycobacterium simiae]